MFRALLSLALFASVLSCSKDDPVSAPSPAAKYVIDAWLVPSPANVDFKPDGTWYPFQVQSNLPDLDQLRIVINPTGLTADPVLTITHRRSTTNYCQWETMANNSLTLPQGGRFHLAACRPGTAAVVIQTYSGVPLDTMRFEVKAPSGIGGNQQTESDFNIELVFLRMPGDPILSLEQKKVYRNAADRWEEVITGDVQDIDFTYDPTNDWSPLLEASYSVDDKVDDLRVFIRVMDLEEDTAGLAWRPWVRSVGKLPIIAEMAVAPDYKDDFSLIMHEMGHCLGFDLSSWDQLGLRNKRDNTFKGSITRSIFLALSAGAYPGGYVPIDDGGGAHWKDSVLGDELMIYGWVWPYKTPLSIITAAAMLDLGYQVNLQAADPYTFQQKAAAKPHPPKPQPRCHIVRRPIKVADEKGRWIDTIQP